MTKSDLKKIKDVIDSAFEMQIEQFHDMIDSTMERHLGSVHEEFTDLRNEIKQDLSKVETTLTAKIDHIDEKLGGFENREVDKRLQLSVRVGRLEKQRS